MNFLNLTKEELLAFFYVFSNIISIIVCILLLIKNRKNKQTLSRIFNMIVLSLGIYYIGDALWAPCYFNLIPNADILIKYTRMIYYIAAGFLGYFWFQYIEIILGSSFVYDKKKKKILYIPVIVSTINAIIMCQFLNPALKNIYGYLTGFALILIPFGFVIIAGILVIIKRKKITDNSLQIRYRILAIWPIVILVISVIQLFIAEIPIYCFGTIIITVSLYIYNQDSLIFTDPLTGINNRNMLDKFIKSGFEKENNNYILMIDIDKFKSINDTYGHLEGDKALKYVADILKCEVGKKGDFLARYGGDEFIIIAEEFDNDVTDLIESIKASTSNSKKNLGYQLTLSIGYSKIEDNNILKYIENADNKLYEEKEIAHKMD